MPYNWLNIFDFLTKVLKAAGLVSEKDRPRNEIVRAVTWHFIFIELIAIFALVSLFTESNLESFAETIALSLTYVNVCIKTINYVHKKDRIQKLIASLKNLIEHESWIEKRNGGERLKIKLRENERRFKFCLSSALIGHFLGTIGTCFAHKLLLKIWFPFDFENNELVFWFLVFYQFVAGFLMTVVLIVIDSHPTIFIVSVTGIIDELSERLENSVIDCKSNKQKNIADKELVKCIEIHQSLKDLVDEISNCFGKVLWLQGFLSAFILCTTAFSLTVVSYKILRLMYL